MKIKIIDPFFSRKNVKNREKLEKNQQENTKNLGKLFQKIRKIIKKLEIRRFLFLDLFASISHIRNGRRQWNQRIDGIF